MLTARDCARAWPSKCARIGAHGDECECNTGCALVLTGNMHMFVLKVLHMKKITFTYVN